METRLKNDPIKAHLHKRCGSVSFAEQWDFNRKKNIYFQIVIVSSDNKSLLFKSQKCQTQIACVNAPLVETVQGVKTSTTLDIVSVFKEFLPEK